MVKEDIIKSDTIDVNKVSDFNEVMEIETKNKPNPHPTTTCKVVCRSKTTRDQLVTRPSKNIQTAQIGEIKQIKRCKLQA